MASLENPNSPQIKLFHECSRGFRKRHLEVAAETLHKDFRYVPYPRSLGHPEQTKEEFLVYWAGIVSLWADDPEESFRFIAETPGKVIAHMDHKVKTTIGFENVRESIFIIHMIPDEDGVLKLEKMEEFTDSKLELDFTQAIAAAAGAK